GGLAAERPTSNVERPTSNGFPARPLSSLEVGRWTLDVGRSLLPLPLTPNPSPPRGEGSEALLTRAGPFRIVRLPTDHPTVSVPCAGRSRRGPESVRNGEEAMSHRVWVVSAVLLGLAGCFDSHTRLQSDDEA